MTKPETEITVPPGEPVIEVRRFLKAPPELVWQVCTESRVPPPLVRPPAPGGVRVRRRPSRRWYLADRAPRPRTGWSSSSPASSSSSNRRTGGWGRSSGRVRPKHEAVETLVLEAVEGGTMMTTTSRHGSLEARDMHVANGMEEGIIDSMERIAELVASVQNG